MLRLFIVVFAAAVFVAPTQAATVSTDDGLSIAFNDADAAITSVSLDGKPLKLNNTPGGFFVVDMVGDKLLGKMDYKSRAFDGARFEATARQSPTGVVIEGKTKNLFIRARIESRGEYLSITGDLSNLRTEDDRAAILYFRLPIDAAGGMWGRNIGVDEPIPADAAKRFINWTHFHQAYRPAMSRLPIASVSGDGWGLSLAQPMDVPRFFRLAYEKPYGFQIEYEFGLSPVTWKFRNRAPFQFLLYRHDPAWSLRSGFDRYYHFFPEQFRKVVRDGQWVVDWDKKKKELDPADYGIVFNETGAWANPEDRSKDVLSMAYIEPWCDHIEATPDGIDAMAKDTPENKKEARFGRGANLRTNALQLLNSVTYGPDGKMFDPRTAAAGGFYVEGSPAKPYYRYLTNPDPELPTPFGGMNRAQKIIQYDLYTAWGNKNNPPQFERDGIYYDSIGSAWAGSQIQNFRRDHMPYVDVPLTFDHKSGKVSITHGFSAIEFLRACTEQARNFGRPTMGNASPGDFLPFVAPWLDMAGAEENYKHEEDFAGLKEVRAMMFQKPVSYLNNAELSDPAKVESALDRMLIYACFPGSNRDVNQLKSQRHLYRAYIPIYQAIGKAGWQPIPQAKVLPIAAARESKPLAPWCERFGDAKHGYFFAIRNPEDQPAELALKLDLKALGIDRATFTAINGCQLKHAAADNAVVTVPAKWTAVIAVNHPEAAALAERHQKELDLFKQEAK